LRVVETEATAVDLNTGTGGLGSTGGNGSGRGVNGRELDVTEALGAAGLGVGREADLQGYIRSGKFARAKATKTRTYGRNVSEVSEGGPDGILGGGEGKVADEEGGGRGAGKLVVL
jgi:hypothetical protein